MLPSRQSSRKSNTTSRYSTADAFLGLVRGTEDIVRLTRPRCGLPLDVEMEEGVDE